MKKDGIVEYWNEYYDVTLAKQSPSQFAEFVLSRFGDRKAVIDVGCGAGRDSFHFASAGWRVVGLDASPNGIALARERCQTFEDRCEFLTFDAGQDDLEALVQVKGLQPSETVIYARFFLHAIPQAAEDRFLRSAASLVQRGARLCIECRTSEDAALPKVEPPHYRRFIVPSRLVERSRDLGMEADFLRVGRGFAPYGAEDPVVVRAFFKRAEADDGSSS